MDKNLVTDEYVMSTALRRWGLTPKRTGHEWHSPCPSCGGRDRFVIFGNGGYFCRQCELTGWLDDDNRDLKPDPLAAKKWLEQQAARRAEQYAKDLAWREGFKVGYIRGWHDAMTARERGWWNSQGITNYQIDHYELGHTDKVIKTDGGLLNVSAFTIPVRDPNDWQTIVNIQYRIEDPPAGVGKYRQEEGISAAAFYAEPNGINSAAVIVEGAKKAMIVYDRLDARVQVIGLPGYMPSECILEQIADAKFSRVFIALDPGCLRQSERIAKYVPNARIMNLPMKPDDAFISGVMTVEKFRAYAAQARRV